eukprot:TRINITY_DN42784_c0_g1_i1.p1 TRINITY_DN42784_c0_g1~~TRINITY_DN42784_c0_g1_i1.p1  ORF type:complete len:294 (+),score=62.61 TRINITY_DN42784_c0_g1_i1:71-883(+)
MHRGGARRGGRELMRETLGIVERGEYRVEGEAKPVKLDPSRRRLRQAPGRAVQHPSAPAPGPARGGARARVRLFPGDTLVAAQLLAAEVGTVPAVLDFASDTTPGGGARGDQTGTQEESVCRRSSLLPSLERPGLYPIPDAGAVYAPDIAVFRAPDGGLMREPFWVGVVAASLRGAGDGELSAAELRRVELKCRCVAAVATHHGHSALVLGAWGCGAFGGSAADVAAVWRRVLADSPDAAGLSEVVFAVPRGRNFDAFSAVFSDAEAIDG